MEVAEIPQGPCVACLYEDELDSSGLCVSCNPPDPRFRVVLLDLLKPVEQQV